MLVRIFLRKNTHPSRGRRPCRVELTNPPSLKRTGALLRPQQMARSCPLNSSWHSITIISLFYYLHYSCQFQFRALLLVAPAWRIVLCGSAGHGPSMNKKDQKPYFKPLVNPINATLSQINVPHKRHWSHCHYCLGVVSSFFAGHVV